jgi:hypothetical protein
LIYYHVDVSYQVRAWREEEIADVYLFMLD